MKICNRCGKEKSREEFYKLKGTQYRDEWDCRDSQCIECRKQTSVERRRGVKQLAVEYLGGKCVDCGIETDQYAIYDFHHIDPMMKDFSMGKSFKSFDKIKTELDKCVLLCANCHRVRHYR